LVLTGTPPGVGPVNPGDFVSCSLSTPDGKELIELDFSVEQRGGKYKFEE